MFAAAAVTAAVGCRNGAVKPPDGSPDGGTADGPQLLSLEVAVTGCASFVKDAGPPCDSNDGSAPRCSGWPPLALSFAPVGSPQLTQFRWTFGDGTAAIAERAPSHTYLLPGCYEVELVGEGNMGTVKPPYPQVIEVLAQPTGAPCDIDGQCAEGLECSCAPGKGCAPAFTHGLCSTACDTAPCPAPAVCAQLAFASGADAGSPVRRARCVAPCANDGDCPPGFACPTLYRTSASGPISWLRGCLPVGAQRDLGSPCRNENEVFDPGSCGTGACADVGALGVCSFLCNADQPCPSGAICAHLRDGRDLCLLPCTAEPDCARDPLLTCVAGLDNGGTDTSVCAPRPCATDDDCAPSGYCDPKAGCRR